MITLLIDGTNLFIRSWTVVPTLSNNGESNGGVAGFLKSLGSIVNMTAPDRVIIVWDGPGGSKKRQGMLETYKQGRKPIRVNRNYDFELENVEQNKIRQRIRLAQYLQDLPVIEQIIPDIEADDVIGYLCQYYNDDDKIIVSSDKDFYQLVGDKVKIYSTSKKIFLNDQDIFKLYNVHPNNFCLYRSIIGDKSDNIKGVYGIGEKKAVKLFDFLSHKEKVELDQFFSFCEGNTEKYKKFLDNEAVIRNNHKLMQLTNPIIGLSSVQKIKQSLDKKISFNLTGLRVKLMEDGIDQLGNYFFQIFRILNSKGNL